MAGFHCRARQYLEIHLLDDINGPCLIREF